MYCQSYGTSGYITLLCCAAGIPHPLMIIYAKSFPGGQYRFEGPDDAVYARSESGWRDSELLVVWLFHKYAVSQRPILLLTDGHKSHINIDVIDLCRSNDVILFCWPPHITHALQPLDVAVFKSLKMFSLRQSELFLSQKRISLLRRGNFPELWNVHWNKPFQFLMSRQILQSQGFIHLIRMLLQNISWSLLPCMNNFPQQVIQNLLVCILLQFRNLPIHHLSHFHFHSRLVNSPNKQHRLLFHHLCLLHTLYMVLLEPYTLKMLNCCFLRYWICLFTEWHCDDQHNTNSCSFSFKSCLCTSSIFKQAFSNNEPACYGGIGTRGLVRHSQHPTKWFCCYKETNKAYNWSEEPDDRGICWDA